MTTGSAGAWAWKKASSTFSLANGAHTLYVRVREPGAQVDKLFITSGSTAPTGLGGAAANCGAGGGGGMRLLRYVALQAAATATPTPAALGSLQQRTLSYAYDGMGRLSGASEATGGTTTATYSYAYDLAGNRTDATSNGVSVHRNYNAANQVSGWQYDAVGNLVNDGTTTYSYDALNQQTSRSATSYAYTHALHHRPRRGAAISLRRTSLRSALHVVLTKPTIVRCTRSSPS